MPQSKSYLDDVIKHFLLTAGHPSADHQLMLDISTENSAVAARLKKAIADLPYSKAEVADRLGVTPQAITGWEATGRIGKKSLAGLAALTGLSVNFFLTGTEATDSAWDSILGRLPGNLSQMRELGSSMLPRLHPGDTALYDPADQNPEDGKLFVIRVEGLSAGTPTVRRCVELGGDVFFEALNPGADPNWAKPRKMADDRHPISILGRVKWIGSWEK